MRADNVPSGYQNECSDFDILEEIYLDLRHRNSRYHVKSLSGIITGVDRKNVINTPVLLYSIDYRYVQEDLLCYVFYGLPEKFQL